MLRKIGLIVLVLWVLLVGAIYTRPGPFEITRSKTLTAPVTAAAPASAAPLPSGG